MTASEEKYLELLRAGLRGLSCPGDVPEEVTRIARSHSTLALVCSGSDNPVIQNEIMRIVVANGKLDAVAALVCKTLAERGISSVLLKGQGLAVNYPNPSLRSCGDIDLYVGGADYAAACDTMSSLSCGPGKRGVSWHHDSFKVKAVEIEVHRHCMDFTREGGQKLLDAFAKAGLSDNLVPVRLASGTVNTPESTFNALYVFCHFLHHFADRGVGWRQLCDWAMLLRARHNDIDTERLGHMLTQMHLMRLWKIFGRIAVIQLGLPAEDMPFYSADTSADAVRETEAFISRIFADGNFGSDRQVAADAGINAHKRFLARRIAAMSTYMHRFSDSRRLCPEIVSYKTLLSTLWAGFVRTFKIIPHNWNHFKTGS